MAAESRDINIEGASREQRDDLTPSATLKNKKDDVEGVVLLAIRDNYDGVSEGMRFRLEVQTPFKHALDAFRSRSCKNCRKRNMIVFEHTDGSVGDEDTLETVRPGLPSKSV